MFICVRPVWLRSPLLQLLGDDLLSDGGRAVPLPHSRTRRRRRSGSEADEVAAAAVVLIAHSECRVGCGAELSLLSMRRLPHSALRSDDGTKVGDSEPEDEISGGAGDAAWACRGAKPQNVTKWPGQGQRKTARASECFDSLQVYKRIDRPRPGRSGPVAVPSVPFRRGGME